MIFSWICYSLNIGCFWFLIVIALFIFLIGLFGILLNRKNLIVMLMSLELLLLAINFIFILASFLLDDINGQIIAFLVLIIAASEVSIGLALMVSYFRVKRDISLSTLNMLYN